MSTTEKNVPPPPSTAENGGRKLHIVMFPWLAFGHMIPFLELSKLIAQKGHKISFVSTPRNIDRLPKLPPKLSPFINFVKLPLPENKNLPENAEATIDVPYDSVKYLKIAYDGLQEPMARFLEESCPDWVLHDFTPYWFKPIADKLNIPTVFFSIFIAAFMGFIGPPGGAGNLRNKPEHFLVPPEWVHFETKVAFKYFEIMRIFDHSIAEEGDRVTDAVRLDMVIRDCDAIAVRSSTELEPEWLNLVQTIHRKPVIPVGQLPTTGYDESGDDGKEKEWEGIKRWLDEQEKGSVVYVAFGSEAKPSQLELTELALGLEQSRLPFFWVLRKQRGSADTELTELPDGFEERVKGRGIVWTSWAPQLKILSHDSVGGFLTHSGWSSVVEAIQFERALILLTFLADQGINARLLEEKGMAYSIPRNELDGSFTSESVAESLRLVIVEEGGKKYREKVKEMRGLFGDEDKQEQYVNNFLDFLNNHTKDTLKKRENGCA